MAEINTVDDAGWYAAARVQKSPNFNARPNNEISLLVIHNISLPAGNFGLPFIEQLLTGCLDCQADPSFAQLLGLEVSSHFLIRRDGELVQFVSCHDRAWHAGVSSFQGRQNCNDFSIGIELEGTDDTPFTGAQYQQLLALSLQLLNDYPAITPKRIVGHNEIAPGRKTDPGACFNWHWYRTELASRYRSTSSVNSG